MSRAFQFQDPGEGIHEAEVLEILVSKGQEVEEGQDVLVVETDKAAFELSSPYSGQVRDIHVSEGDSVSVGDKLLSFADEEAADEEAANEEAANEEAADEEEQDRSEAEARASDEEATDEEGQKDSEAEAHTSDDEEAAQKPSTSSERAAEARASEDEKAGDEQGAQPEDEEAKASDQDRSPVPATPATRRRARELGVDLRQVKASGEQGRVLTRDVETHANAEPSPRTEQREPPSERKAKEREEPPSEVEERPARQAAGERREKLRSIRRTTAKRMARAWAEIPHVTHHDQADITDLDAFRQRMASRIEKRGGKLTLTALTIKALCATLHEFPRFNASFDADAEELIYKRDVHVGVAVDTERGLLVPVVREADKKSLGELTRELTEVAERARSGKLTREQLSGGTFTVTNVGPIGGTGFTPIINPPQVAILGLAAARLQPVVRGGLEDYEVVPRLILPLAIGFDHRVIDGAESAKFARRLVEQLEDVDEFVLSV